MKHLKRIKSAQSNDQGTALRLELELAEGDRAVEVPISEIQAITELLCVGARQAGALRNMPTEIQQGQFEPMPIVDASAMAVALGKPGCVTMLFRVGAVDLAFSVPQEAFQQSMHKLPSAVATLEAIAKATR